jgi:hypothetical protein
MEVSETHNDAASPHPGGAEPAMIASGGNAAKLARRGISRGRFGVNFPLT